MAGVASVTGVTSVNRITVDHQRAELGIDVTRGEMHITTPHPTMTITHEAPEMEIESKAPSFKVNWKKINTEIGLKPPSEFTKGIRDAGRQGALRGTKVAAEDGNFLSDLKIPGDRVPKLAKKKSMEAVLKRQDFNISLMPKDRAEIEWDKGYIRVSWSKHSIVIDCEGTYMPEVKVDPPYSIEVFLSKKPYIRVAVEEGPSPMHAGQHINKVV